MKKIIAILLCAMLMLSCLAVVAESGIMPLTDRCENCDYMPVYSHYTVNACTVHYTTRWVCKVCSYEKSKTDEEDVTFHKGDKIEGRCSVCGEAW